MTLPLIDLKQSNAATVAGIMLFGLVGANLVLSLPMVVSALTGVFGFSNKEAGQFSSIQMISASIGCLVSIPLTRRFNMKSMATLAIAALIAADLISPFIRNFLVFLVLRGVAGLSCGFIISSATGTLAQTKSVDRNFGLFVFAQIIFSMAASFLLPILTTAFGIKGVFFTFMLIDIIGLLVVLALMPPVTLGAAAIAYGGNDIRRWTLCLMVLFAALTFFIAIGAFWTYIGRIGEAIGLSSLVVGRTLSLAAIGGMAGAIMPVILPSRFGRTAPIFISLATLLGGVMIMWNDLSLASFTSGVALFSFGWYSLFPYLLGVLASIDRDGRPAVAVMAFASIGMGIGPALVALYVEKGLQASFMVAAFSLTITAILMFSTLFSVRRDVQETA